MGSLDSRRRPCCLVRPGTPVRQSHRLAAGPPMESPFAAVAPSGRPHNVDCSTSCVPRRPLPRGHARDGPTQSCSTAAPAASAGICTASAAMALCWQMTMTPPSSSIPRKATWRRSRHCSTKPACTPTWRRRHTTTSITQMPSTTCANVGCPHLVTSMGRRTYCRPQQIRRPMAPRQGSQRGSIAARGR